MTRAGSRPRALAIVAFVLPSCLLSYPLDEYSKGGQTSPSTSACTTATLFQDGFESLPLGTGWVAESVHGNWKCLAECSETGITSDGSNVLRALTRTLADSFVNSVQTFGDFDATLRLKTVEQLGPNPKDYSVGGFMWHASPKNDYFVLLKPTGFEFAKHVPCGTCVDGIDTKYFNTLSNPVFPLRTWHTLRVRQAGGHIEVWVNNERITEVTDSDPLLSGAFGFWALGGVHAVFDDLVVCAP